MKWRLLARVACWFGGVLLALELLYLVAANVLLFSGIIQREASKPPENVNVAWDRAYTLWPVRAYVSGFRMRVQDQVQEFSLTVDHAKVDIVLWDLIHRKFHASWVRAEGVSYRQVVKVESVAGRERRLAAFPPIEGFPRPALQAKTKSPPLTPEELAQLWSVELDDVGATLTELWFLEYRYRGPARIHGGFAFSPLRRLWVGPALLQLDGGELTAGERVVSSSFAARAEVTLAPLDLATSPGLLVLHTLTSSVHFDTALDDLGVVELYVDGLRARGKGRLEANVEIADAKLMPGSTLEAWLPGSDVQIAGYHFTGKAQAKLSVSDDTKAPTVHGTLGGRLEVPIGKEPVVAVLSEVAGELVLAGGDLSRGLRLEWLRATLGEARVEDARALTRKVGTVVPLFSRLVLGEGPLIASASMYMTPEYELVRLEKLTLGDAELAGAAVAGANGWNGAAAGHFGKVSLGLRLRDGRFEPVPLVSSAWLGEELGKVGIKPE